MIKPTTSNSIANQAVHLFREQYGRRPVLLVRAPGRVTLLGAHVDYSDGWVLSGAIDRAVWVAAAPVSQRTVTVYSMAFRQRSSFSLDHLWALPAQSWLRYPMGVAWTLQSLGHSLCGMEVVLASDLPMGAGISSSAAVEMAMVMAWEAISGFQLTRLARVRVGQHAENEYLGVGSGIMDQFICVHGEKDRVILLDCRSLAYEVISLPPDTAIVLADSGVRRSLAEIRYNDRPQECQEAVVKLRQFMPNIQTLRDVSLQDFERHAHRLPVNLRLRAKHVISECARAQEGAAALRRQDLVRFGRLMNRSQASSRDNYENSTAELDFLASTAEQIDGCYGARFAGGGFGGFMQLLAKKSAVTTIQRALSQAFRDRFSRDLALFTCRVADGGQQMSV